MAAIHGDGVAVPLAAVPRGILLARRIGLVAGPALAFICYATLPEHYAGAAGEVEFSAAGAGVDGVDEGDAASAAVDDEEAVGAETGVGVPPLVSRRKSSLV